MDSNYAKVRKRERKRERKYCESNKWHAGLEFDFVPISFNLISKKNPTSTNFSCPL